MEDSENNKGRDNKEDNNKIQVKKTSTTDLVEVGVEAGWEAVGGIIGDWTCAMHRLENNMMMTMHQDDHT